MDEMNEKKRDFIEKVVSIGVDYDVDYLQTLIKDLKIFLYEHCSGKDRDISEAILIAEALTLKHEENYQEGAAEIVAPIISRLESTKKWNSIDITYLSIIIRFAENPEQVIKLVERMLGYSDSVYDDFKITTLCNSTLFLLKAKFKRKIDLEKLTEIFNKYTELGLNLCNKNENRKYNFIDRHIFLIRRNLFEFDEESIKESLSALRKEKEYDLVKILTKEIEECKSYKNKSLEKINVDEKVGKNLRKIRTKRKLTVDEVADYLGVSKSYVSHFEKGTRNIPVPHLEELAELLDVSIDEFFGREQAKDEEEKTNLKLIGTSLSTNKITRNGVNLFIENITRVSEILDIEEELEK
ncbi:MAG: helix-turn-helix domain-containing protein [Defluviitaleaceae bacterium]|nr:helix-turn-helix domain-containing protein [Defluviitaleaceae bacterium]